MVTIDSSVTLRKKVHRTKYPDLKEKKKYLQHIWLCLGWNFYHLKNCYKSIGKNK